MKYLSTLVSFVFGLSAHATHWVTYPVYVEEEYIQGPWIRGELVEASMDDYLVPLFHEDLIGSEKADLVHQMMARLQETRPGRYEWSYELAFRGDTVVLKAVGPIKELTSVKNEVTATLILNGFDAIVIQVDKRAEVWTMDDLTVPYLDLISMPQTVEEPLSADQPFEENDESLLPLWLCLSGLLNLGLIGLVIRRSRQ